MTEKYKSLYFLPSNLYSEGSPVVIAAGELVLDQETRHVLARLRLKNISGRVIRGVKVILFPLDRANRPLGDVVKVEYDGLSAGRDAEFGQEKIISLPMAKTRAFTAEVFQVVFKDRGIWVPDVKNWRPLPVPEEIKDDGLLKQVQARFGKRARYLTAAAAGLWFCACGCLNREEEAACHSCGAKHADLISEFRPEGREQP